MSRLVPLRLTLLAGILLLAGLALPVAADVGPKPTAAILVYLDSQLVSESPFYARMLSCDTGEPRPLRNCNAGEAICQKFEAIDIAEPARQCAWQPAEMAWGGDCAAGRCDFTYFLPNPFRLAVYLPQSDRLYISNEATREQFNSTYRADLLPDGTARLVETTSILNRVHADALLAALLLSIVLELIVAAVYVLLAHRRWRVLLGIPLANLATVPLVWLATTSAGAGWAIFALLGGELLAVGAEAGILHGLNRRHLSFKSALLLSFLMNTVSFIVGTPILLMLAFIGI